MPPHTVVVLGGGISGLSVAFYLARTLPLSSRVLLLERSERVGGYIRSPALAGDAAQLHPRVTLEAGPRTLRPNSTAVLELINVLGLESSLITVTKTDPAAKARYMYMPPLTLLPSSLASLLASPLNSSLRPLLPAIFREITARSNRPSEVHDESVHAFIARRFGENFARQFLSTIIHGVYAADSRRLSIRAAFPSMWEAEEVGNGSILWGFIKQAIRGESGPAADAPTYDLGSIESKMRGVSIFTFQGGMETLARSLYDWLLTRPNVEVRLGVDITSIEPVENGIKVNFLVETSTGSLPFLPERVISTIPLPILEPLIPTSHKLPHLTHNSASSVTVINFVFPPTPKPIHPTGFGYLIPRPIADYPKEAPEGTDMSYALLGTVFDDAIPTTPLESVSVEPSDSSSSLQPSRLTCMLGGPYPLPSPLPPLEDIVPPLLRTLASHLGIAPTDIPEPLHVAIHEQKDCIPTYDVGHVERMRELSVALGDGGAWRGRMDVIGTGVGGISVGDSVKAARETALKLSQK
ncbi:hypothetical protein BS47DRAFT_1305007 [Hydnum rufescens UP504]|uniref:Protoporphyrinogen oxidase n=1 Tax=Hydnum rufescens UP504 TaxID=1448309 RepID=A0A9P6AJD3_9AGAM|nr:hypothetical protein BS47DRAFT_1305007 [Hydnum rufescens UP504]